MEETKFKIINQVIPNKKSHMNMCSNCNRCGVMVLQRLFKRVLKINKIHETKMIDNGKHNQTLSL